MLTFYKDAVISKQTGNSFEKISTFEYQEPVSFEDRFQDPDPKQSCKRSCVSQNTLLSPAWTSNDHIGWPREEEKSEMKQSRLNA